MKILLIGHGRMGQLIEKTAVSQGMEIAHVIDIDNKSDLWRLGKVADIAMDFSHPSMLPQVCEYVRRTGTPYLCGTTGCSPQENELVRGAGEIAPVVHSANYSLGVAVMRRAVIEISKVLKDSFDIEVTELHHNQKIDAPSGTAKMLIDAIDPAGEYRLVYGRQGICGKRGEKEIGVHSLRGGSMAGEHTVGFFGQDEVVEITHKAVSRQIFVSGALHCAGLLTKMRPGYYTLQQILFERGENA